VKIVILDGYTENPGDLSWEGFAQLGELTVYDRSSLTDPRETIERIGDAYAVITNKTPITREILNVCPAVRYIGVLATGYNVVDTVAAREQNITVCNIPAYGTAAVGQFAIALLLEICCRIGHHSDAVRAGRWENSVDWCFWDYPLIELAGKTIGIIGFGRIGQTTGRIAAALGMTVIAVAGHRDAEGEGAAEYVTIDELYARSDVIALHCPLSFSTEGMICKESIAKMKDGVIILNNARGPLINEQDLADALNAGKICAAGLDVVSSEPIKGDNPLLKAKNCFITPHISWASKESRRRLMDIATDNLRSFMSGNPVNVVNK
jgi:glycerate dehydrogenase